MVRGDHEILFVGDLDSVEALFPTDNVVGDAWTAVRAEEEITLLDILDLDARAVILGEESALGETCLESRLVAVQKREC